MREKDNRDSAMSTATVTPATIVRGAIARSARANVVASPATPAKVCDDVRPPLPRGEDTDAQPAGPAQAPPQVRSHSPEGSDSGESITSMTMSMSTSGTTSTSADSRPQTLNVVDVQEWKARGILPKTTIPSPLSATFRDVERELVAPALSLTIADENKVEDESALLSYSHPSVAIDTLASPLLSLGDRAASPASTYSSSASPGTPAPRYPGWVSEVLAPLRTFINDLIDPRDLYSDLQEIAEGESGSVYAARVIASSSGLDDSAASYIAIKNVPLLPSGSPKLVDLRRELELMKNVQHPHILTMDALYVDLVEDSLWIRMDLMERSLADVIGLVGEGIVLEEALIAQFASDVRIFICKV